MANIGSFKKVGDEFQGEILTLSVQTKNVRIVAESNRSNDNAPSHRVFVGRAEIGAAWSKRSNDGRDYLSLKLDDPSFNAPIFANLFDDEGGESYSLIWSRSRKIKRRMSRTSPKRPARDTGRGFRFAGMGCTDQETADPARKKPGRLPRFFARLLPGLWPAAPGDGRRAAVRRDAGLMVGGGFRHRRRADCQPEIPAKDAFHGRQVSSERYAVVILCHVTLRCFHGRPDKRARPALSVTFRGTGNTGGRQAEWSGQPVDGRAEPASLALKKTGGLRDKSQQRP